MATKKQASLALAKVQAALKKRGAHAIDVRPVAPKQGYGVFIHFTKAPSSPVPAFVHVNDGEHEADVPLRVVIDDQFKPE